MAPVDDFYDAIEAGDTETLTRILNDEPTLVEAAGATPPPIHWAIFHDRASIMEILIEHGADIERRDQDRDATPLSYAIVYGRAGLAQLLMRRGAETEGMHELAERGAAGEFDQYPDVASREQFAELVKVIARA